MSYANPSSKRTLATCPACGLLCDDVSIRRIDTGLQADVNCVRARAFFAQNVQAAPTISGKKASLDDAITHAVHLLQTSQQPLFAGLGTDISGFRALNTLAKHCNAHMQHMHAGSTQRNMAVLQSVGWQMTTLTEVKNRADVLLCFGNVAAHIPRFFERFIEPNGMFVNANQREIIAIGDKIDTPKGAWILGCRADDLPEITSVLRALIAGKTIKADKIAGVKISDLQTLADKLKAAKYAVLAWVAKDLDFPHAELTIQNITETVAMLNTTTRAAGLALGGADGDTGANYAHTWLNGTALQANRYAASGAYDLQVWVNSFSPDAPPSVCHTPTIVLGNANTPWAPHVDVFIPIATPGLDCNGTLFRVDGSVVLPLKKVRESNLLTLSEVVGLIEARLT